MSSIRIRALPRWSLFAFSGVLAVAAGVGIYHYHATASQAAGQAGSKNLLTKEQLAEALGDSASFFRFPAEMDLPIDNHKVHGVVQYAFDASLQEKMETLFKQYGPDYGAFVAMDAKTGRVLAMVSYSRNQLVNENLALRATFPSASVFKMVTAAAAIEERKFSPDTVIPFNGANHTLYRGNILKTRYTRWTRYATLKDAFAKSINTVFGRIGAYTVGAAELREYADRFGFNRRIAADLPMQEGKAAVPADPNDAWGIAEAASGYTRDNTMSPLQGALMAAAVANDGVMMEPYVVQSVYTTDGSPLYAAEPKVSETAVDASTAAEIRQLMRETVARGTSRKSFRGFFRGKYAQLDVGGKTGSLTGDNPPGKYDWFVGFAKGGSQRIAVAALTIHEKLWRVKSSYLARRAFEAYFKGVELDDGEVAANQ